MNALSPRLLFSLALFGAGAVLPSACSRPKSPPVKVMHALPSEWDAAVYLPYKTANDTLGLFKGLTVPVKAKGLEDLEIEVEQIVLSGGEGVATAAFQMAARKKGKADALLLKASGEARPGAFARNTDGAGVVSFAINVSTVQPGAEFRGERFLSGDLIGSLSAGVINEAFGDALTLRIPLPVDLAVPLKSESELSFNTPAGGLVNVKVTTPDVTIPMGFESLATVFCPSGLWVCSDFKPAAASTAPVAPRISEYEATGGTEAKVLLSARMVEQIINDYSGKEDVLRTAKAEVTGHQGDLFEKRMEADGLGKGGLKIWLENDAGTGSLTVKPRAAWNPGKGVVDIVCDYRASAEADLHVHVDPVVSGGVGTSVGCRGSSGATVSGTLAVKVFAGPAGSAVGLAPEFAAGQALVAKASTNGKLKFDFLNGMASVNVPDIGVKVELPVPPDIVPFIPVLNSAPIRIPLPAAKEPAEAQPAPYVVAVAKDKPVATKDGFVVGFDISISQMNKADANAARKSVAEALDTARHPKLEIGKIALLVGDLEFGQNNELVRILATFVKTVGDAANAIAGTAKDVARETGRAATRVGKEVKVGLRNTREAIMTVAGQANGVLNKLPTTLGTNLPSPANMPVPRVPSWVPTPPAPPSPKKVEEKIRGIFRR